MRLHRRAWGRGEPLIALHPLALEASAFAGLGKDLAAHGLRTIAVDLPGFGKSAAPDAPLTPARLAEPVIRMARRMKTRPALLGISMGGRVALEAALAAPEAFRAAILVAPHLPWLRFRWALLGARLLSPGLAAKIPLETVGPLLKRIARVLDTAPFLRGDPFARAGAQLTYYASCPATRAGIVSAAREMALEPSFGEHGLWDRLPQLQVPAAFIWGRRDRLVPMRFAYPVGEALPGATQVVLPCLGHALHGAHHRCLAGAVASTLTRELRRPASRRRAPRRRRAKVALESGPCCVEEREPVGDVS